MRTSELIRIAQAHLETDGDTDVLIYNPAKNVFYEAESATGRIMQYFYLFIVAGNPHTGVEQ